MVVGVRDSSSFWEQFVDVLVLLFWVADTFYQVMYDDVSYERYGPGDYQYTMHFAFKASIKCADGTGQAGQIVIDRDYVSWTAAEGDSFENADALLAEVWDDASDRVASIAERICPPEKPELYS